MIDASTGNTIEAGFQTIANNLNLPRDSTPDASVNAVKSWLATHPGWLLIFDHAEDEALKGERYFPGGTGGMVLITGRDIKLQRYAVPLEARYAKAYLGPLGDDESKRLLLQLCRTMSEEERQLEEH